MRRGRNRVVRRLTHVHMRIRVHAVLPLVTGEDFVREIPDHLVHVHIEAGVAAALPHIKRKLFIERAVERPVCCLHDRVRDLGVERSDLSVRAGRGFLDPRHRAEDIRIENDGKPLGSRHT